MLSLYSVSYTHLGMIACVGKTYRMLQEAHDLLDNGVDVNIGYVETHGRAGTEAVLANEYFSSLSFHLSM